MREAIAQRAVCSPGCANQSVEVHRPISSSKLHRSIEQGLLIIGDEEILRALGVADIGHIGTLLELETLSAADGEGGEGQNECLDGGMHEVGRKGD